MSWYVKTFKVKDGDKDKNNKLMSFCKKAPSGLRLKTYKKLNALPASDDRYIKTKIRTCSDKVYHNFCGLNVAEDGVECESFTNISIDSLFAYGNKNYLQIYSDNCDYKIGVTQMLHYLDDNLFETEED